MMDYITFGKGEKTLVLIQGLNTNDDITGAKLGLMYMYRQFLKEYTVYVFSRPNKVYEGITIDDLARDLHFSGFSGWYDCTITGYSLSSFS